AAEKRRPVMHAGIIDAGLEDVGIARQAERGQVATVGPAPQSDLFRVDVRQRLQIFRGRDDVLVLARAAMGSRPCGVTRYGIAGVVADEPRHTTSAPAATGVHSIDSPCVSATG